MSADDKQLSTFMVKTTIDQTKESPIRQNTKWRNDNPRHCPNNESHRMPHLADLAFGNDECARQHDSLLSRERLRNVGDELLVVRQRSEQRNLRRNASSLG